MKSFSIVTLVLLTAACAHGREAASAEVVVVPPSCFDPLSRDAVTITIVNDSSERLAFSSSGTSGPPYSLHPWAFELAATGADATDAEHWAVILEDFVAPDHEVSLGPGDRAEFHAYTSRWPTSEYHGQIELSVRDTHGRRYASRPVRVCASG